MKRYEFTEDETDVLRRLIFHYQSASKSRADVDLYARKDHALSNTARVTLGVCFVKLGGGTPVRQNTMGRPRTLPR